MPNNDLTLDQKLVFAYSPESQVIDGMLAPHVLIGVPEGAWEYMRDGKTHTLDLTKIGVPLRLLMFGAKDHKAAMAVLKGHNETISRNEMVDARERDFSLPEPNKK